MKQRREACGLTQTELAVQAGVSLPSIQKMESGRANPSLKTLTSVFDVLGVDVEFHMRSAKTTVKPIPRKTEAAKSSGETSHPEPSPGLFKETHRPLAMSERAGTRAGQAISQIFKMIDKVIDSPRDK